jgi:hypothetical protein
MNYSVVWTSDALEDFLEIWLSSSDKASLTNAAERIGDALAKEPLAKKYEVVGGAGIAIHDALGVDFRVHPSSRTVTVIAAWLAPNDVEWKQ